MRDITTASSSSFRWWRVSPCVACLTFLLIFCCLLQECAQKPSNGRLSWTTRVSWYQNSQKHYGNSVYHLHCPQMLSLTFSKSLLLLQFSLQVSQNSVPILCVPIRSKGWNGFSKFRFSNFRRIFEICFQLSRVVVVLKAGVSVLFIIVHFYRVVVVLKAGVSVLFIIVHF